MANSKSHIGNIKSLFDSNALWLSMIIGAVGYKIFLPLRPLLPWLIFFMLFFTFCKVNPLDLRLHKWHWAVLAAQLFFSFASYGAVMFFSGNEILAQGLLMCFIMPTATAAPIIAGKMGGSIQNLTMFTLLSNFATAVIVPATFPLINPASDMSFFPAFLLILSRVAPLLLVPFFAAWLLRISVNAYYRRKAQITNSQSQITNPQSPITNSQSQITNPKTFELPKSLAVIPFYLWVASIVVLMATVTQTVVTNFQLQITNILILLVSSFFACLLQFGLGKLIGYRLPAASKGTDYQDVLINPAAAPKNMNEVSSITAGQAFGQKNTSLGVWMAQTYLSPMAALGAAAYIIWQNIFNSAQLFFVARGGWHRRNK